MDTPRPCDVPLGCPGVHGGLILEYLCSEGSAIIPPNQPEPPPHHGGGWSYQPPREGGDGGPGGGRGEEGEHTGGDVWSATTGYQERLARSCRVVATPMALPSLG